jgi:hypothetical protein
MMTGAGMRAGLYEGRLSGATRAATMADEDTNRGAFLIQEHYCRVMDAPITARVCLALAAALSRDTRTGARALDWPGQPTQDALPLRLAGGLHALHRAGVSPALDRVYHGEATDSAEVAAIVAATLARHDAALLAWLDGPPQTNEAGRSAALMTGLLAVARAFPWPFEVLEIGSSAGLNLLIDRFRYDLGGLVLGPADAAVTIRPEWRGPPPEPAPVAFAGVRGVDVAPIDVTDPAAAERLAAYVWADAPARLARLEGAIAMVRAGGVALEAGDAADWIDARLAAPQAAGTTRVLMHSVVWQYLGAERQARIRAAMAAAGAAATPDRPLAWVRMEPNRDGAVQEVWVRHWPDGAPAVRVAFAHAHGTWIEPAADPGDGDPGDAEFWTAERLARVR